MDSLFSHPATGARRTDPDTSEEGAEVVAWRATNHKAILLQAYHGATRPLSDREAFRRSRLVHLEACCWWKRCSELRTLGMLEVVGTTMCPSSGSRVQTCIITGKGVRAMFSAQRNNQVGP